MREQISVIVWAYCGELSIIVPLKNVDMRVVIMYEIREMPIDDY